MTIDYTYYISVSDAFLEETNNIPTENANPTYILISNLHFEFCLLISARRRRPPYNFQKEFLALAIMEKICKFG